MIKLTDEDVFLVTQRYREKLERIEEELEQSPEDKELLRYYYVFKVLLERRNRIGWRRAMQEHIDLCLELGHTELEAKKSVGLI